jgi:uncharacterized protein YjbJ (UPF0337 family)
MTMQDRAKKALAKATGALDSAIGAIFGDEQLEARTTGATTERRGDRVRADELRRP